MEEKIIKKEEFLKLKYHVFIQWLALQEISLSKNLPNLKNQSINQCFIYLQKDGAFDNIPDWDNYNCVYRKYLAYIQGFLNKLSMRY